MNEQLNAFQLEVEKRSIARSTKIEQLLAEYIENKQVLAERKEKMVSATKDLTDEAFAARLEDTKELLGLAAFPDFLKKKKDGKKEDEKEEDKKKDAKASDEEGITDPDILANVKATASVSAGNEVVSTDNGTNNWKSLAADLLGASKRGGA